MLIHTFDLQRFSHLSQNGGRSAKMVPHLSEIFGLHDGNPLTKLSAALGKKMAALRLCNLREHESYLCASLHSCIPGVRFPSVNTHKFNPQPTQGHNFLL